MTRYSLIALIAIVAMPAAAAGNFGLAAYEAMTGRAPVWFAVLIGMATAVGLEATGVLLGHTATGYWQRKDRARFAVSALGMALYVGFGTWEMAAIPFGRVVPALAALAYFAAAMQGDLHTAVSGDATKADARMEFDLQQARLDRETTRLLRVERERAKLVAVAAANPAPQTFADDSQDSQTATLYECACGKVYEKPQSYSAHTRHCAAHAATVAKNGHLKEIEQ